MVTVGATVAVPMAGSPGFFELATVVALFEGIANESGWTEPATVEPLASVAVAGSGAFVVPVSTLRIL